MQSRLRCFGVALLALLFHGGLGADAQTPVDGYYPLVGMALSNEFDEDFNFFPSPTFGVSESDLLGPAGSPHYDLALLDTGAGFSVMSSAGFDAFNLGGSYPGESDGYVGTESVTIGGATGQLLAPINDPFGLYVAGLQDRTAAGASLQLDNSVLNGQTNTATITLPPESELPNIVGLPFAGQYATRISSDQPQVFELGGKTIRTPGVEFLPLGSGGGDIVRKAPLSLNPGAAFAQPPAYLPNIVNFDIDKPQENPSTPTLVQGGLFVNAEVANQGSDLGGPKEFFFDTGASVTVVSELNALRLGFDVLLDDPEFTISVVGSGGLLSDIPGFFVEEFTIEALGGSMTATNVPVIVLDVADPSDPGNVVEGILGTNLFSGRNIVIDPNPSLGGGGESAGLYISDPVTDEFAWASAQASALWQSPDAWGVVDGPDLLSDSTVRPVGTADQEALVTGDGQAWGVAVEGGDGGERMTVRIESGASLTTFSGVTVGSNAEVLLEASTLDAQYVDIRGGRLAGSGAVRTGSGPIEGQVEALSGQIAPEGVLSIDGRLSLGAAALVEVDLAGELSDRIEVTGSVGLAGELSVSIQHTPYLDEAFDILTYDSAGGAFDTIRLPDAYEWQVVYGPDALTLSVIGLAGDFNTDGVVDAADYQVWRAGFGTIYDESDLAAWDANYGAFLAPQPSGLDGDFNSDGVVDAADYVVWRNGFGTLYDSAGFEIWSANLGESLVDGAQGVPEPGAVGLLAVAGLLYASGRMRSPQVEQKLAVSS